MFKAGGPRNFELFWRHQVPPFDKDGALAFLRGVKGDMGAISYIRSLLAERGAARDLSRMDDDAILGEVASLIASGEIFVGFRFQVMTAADSGEVRDEPVPAPAEPARPAPKPPPEDPPTLTSNNDPKVQAQVLVAAAQRGVPFCEECARAAAELAQPVARPAQVPKTVPPKPAEAPKPVPAKPVAAPPTLSPNNDAAAQARVLTDAAESGVPFCEECARAAAGGVN